MTARVARAIQKRRCDRQRKFLSPEKTPRFLLVHSAAVGERTESERREDEQQSAYQSSAWNVCWGCFECLRCVRECAYSEELRFAFKRWNSWIKISREKGRFVSLFGRFLSLSNLFFFFRDFASPEGGERECWLRALIKEKKRGAEVDRSRTERESERRYDTY